MLIAVKCAEGEVAASSVFRHGWEIMIDFKKEELPEPVD
jgi:hypothetical protein